MPLLILTVIIQACFIFHVFKTGRPYWWAYVILGFPVAGEASPESKRWARYLQRPDNLASR
jgi:hypothetical protein